MKAIEQSFHVNRYKAVTQLALKKNGEGRSCLAETSLQVLLTSFLTLTRVSAKHKKFSIEYFHVALFIMLHKAVLTFKSVDETLVCDHSNESY